MKSHQLFFLLSTVCDEWDVRFFLGKMRLKISENESKSTTFLNLNLAFIREFQLLPSNDDTDLQLAFIDPLAWSMSYIKVVFLKVESLFKCQIAQTFKKNGLQK